MPWQACRQILARIGRSFKSSLAGRRGNIEQLCFDAEGITHSCMTTKRQVKQRKIAWSQIKSLHAFKRDLFTVDQICMALALKNGDVLQFDEDMEGWRELLLSLPDYLHGCKPFHAWWPHVAFPPFENNMTLVYHGSTFD